MSCACSAWRAPVAATKDGAIFHGCQAFGDASRAHLPDEALPLQASRAPSDSKFFGMVRAALALAALASTAMAHKEWDPSALLSIDKLGEVEQVRRILCAATVKALSQSRVCSCSGA